VRTDPSAASRISRLSSARLSSWFRLSIGVELRWGEGGTGGREYGTRKPKCGRRRAHPVKKGRERKKKEFFFFFFHRMLVSLSLSEPSCFVFLKGKKKIFCHHLSNGFKGKKTVPAQSKYYREAFFFLGCYFSPVRRPNGFCLVDE
jgi:hypothetical protein